MRSHAKAPSVGSSPGAGRTHLSRILVLCSALVVVLAFAVPAHAATRAKLAELGAPFNTGLGGALSNISGVGVNRTGAGAVGVGEVYVSESGGNRISEFSPTNAFVRTWGYDVVSSGQDNTGANEQQTVQVKATKGAFSLTVTTAAGVGTRTVGSATVTGVSNTFGTFHVGDAISGTGIPNFTRIVAVGSGTLTLSQAPTASSSDEMTATENTGATGTGNLTAGSAEVTALTTRTGQFAVGKTVTGTGIPVGTTILAVGAGTLTLSNPVEAGKSGTGIVLTATNIPYNAGAAEVQTALEALSGVDPGDVAVSGGPGDATGSVPYVVTFSGGRFAGNDVAELGQSAAGLSEGTKTVTIAAPMQGGGIEICKAVSSPADVCKKGTSSTVAGGLAGPSGLAVDQSTGNVYVYNGNTGKRVDVFSAKGVFEGAFGWNVISSGAVGTGTLAAGSTSVTAVATTSRAFLVGQTITGTGIPAGTTIATVGAATNTITLSRPATASGAGVALTVSAGAGNVPQNEKQTVTIGGAPNGGTFTLTFKAPKPSEASATATAIPFNASAAEVQAKLEGLANIGAGNVEVSGSAGGPFTVEFKGTRYADTNVIEMTASGAGLTPAGTVAIATPRDGGALELCTAASGCLPGESSASAGGFGNSATSPRGLSVDSSGNLYVPDSGNLRFDVFSPTLNGSDEVTGASFVRAVGWGVADGATAALQTCTTTCFKGLSGSGAGQFGEGLTAAIVDSIGNVYTVNSVGNCATITCRIQKFNPDGTIANPSFGPSTGECSTVRSSGFVTGPSGTGISAVAVDPASGNVFAYIRTTSTTERICELDSSGNELGVFPSAPLTSANPGNGLAVGTGERVYAGNVGVLFVFGPVPPPVVEILPVTEIGQSSAKLNGKVTVPSPGGEGFNTTYRFEVSADAGFHWTKVPASDVSIGSTAGTFEVNQVATGLQPNANYLVRLVATTGPSATSGQEFFSTLAGAPTVDYPAAVAPLATETTAKVKGFVNPNNSPTTYHFEYGTTTSYGSQSPDFDPFVGAGGQPLAVTATLSGLSPDTVYHYRLVATNAIDTTKGEDRRFTTAEARQALNAAGLPADRAFELVSPADKGPAGSVAEFGLVEQPLGQASPDGSSIVYPIQNGIPDSTAGGWTRWRADRTGGGWLSTQLSAPSLVPAPEVDGLGFTIPSKVIYSSADNRCGFLQTFNPLTSDTLQISVERGVVNLYRWSEEGYELISHRMPLNPDVSAPVYTQIEAAEDCSRVYFRSPYVFIAGGSGLYEWEDGGTLRDAGVLPNGVPGAEAVVGAETSTNRTSRWNAVSPDGSRLFFSAISNQGPDSGKRAVFMREDGVVTDISQSQTGVPTGGAMFEAASPDGSRAFFKANYGIAPNGTSAGPTNGDCFNASAAIQKTPCDLYAYDVESGELTDLSPDTSPADGSVGAQVQGTVSVDPDGSHVYFAALGRLIAGKGATYAENVAGGMSANVYLAREGELSYVTTLAASDLFSFQAANSVLMRFTSSWSADTTPEGNRLLFATRSDITGYESGGAWEAYLYSAETGETACLSCRADGLLSLGSVLDPTFPLPQPVLARRGRAMSEDGSRVFFMSVDALVPGVSPGRPEKEIDGGAAFRGGRYNVYEWHNGQVYYLATVERAGGNGRGELLDISADGKDVFIATNEQLVSQDKDLVADVYDLRAGGGFAPEVVPERCDPAADECQGPPVPQPPAPAPVSAGFQGAGNPPAPAAKQQVKKKKKKKASKKKRRSKRNRAAKANRGGAK